VYDPQRRGEKVGEIKLQRSYQLVPPSWKPGNDGQRADYRMLKEGEPATIELAVLLENIVSHGLSFERSESRLEENVQKLQDWKQEARERTTNAQAKAREFLEQTLGRTKKGQRNQDGFDLACQCRDLGLTESETADILQEYQRGAPKGPDNKGEEYTSSAAMASVEQAFSRAPREPPRSAEARAGRKQSPGQKAQTAKRKGSDERAKIEIINPDSCNVTELLEISKRWLHIEEDYAILGPACVALANFCPGDPDIIGIIGPSGSSKTEIVRSFGERQNQYVYPLSSITPRTLISGHKEGKDLVPRLEKRLLAIKDLTTTLSKNEDDRAQIFAQFRELTDGYIQMEFGIGPPKEYHDIHSSILFASTNAIERYYSLHATMGQRMIFLRPRGDPQKARERAAENRNKLPQMREELHSAIMRFIRDRLAEIDQVGLPGIPEDRESSLGKMCDFLAIARTHIHHNIEGEIDEIPEPEYPTRLMNAISRLMQIHALVFGRETTDSKDLAFATRIVQDNIPTIRWQVLAAMGQDPQPTAEVGKAARMPTGPAKRILEELVALKLVHKTLRSEKEEGQDKRADSYELTPETQMMVRKLSESLEWVDKRKTDN